MIMGQIISGEEIYYCCLEFTDAGEIIFNTAAKENQAYIDDYMKTHGSERPVSEEMASDSNRAFTLQSIQQALGIVNNYKQMAGELAENAPLDRLEQAKAMYYEEGENSDAIWKATGWKLGAGDNWMQKGGSSTIILQKSQSSFTGSTPSTIQSIQQALGIVNKYKQMAGEMAENAPLGKLARAQAMYYEEGENADAIWKATGWRIGADDKWRFEIPDNLTKIDLWAKEKKSAKTLGIEAEGQQDRVLGTSSLNDIIREKLGIVNKFEYKNLSPYKPSIDNIKPEFADRIVADIGLKQTANVMATQAKDIRKKYEGTSQWMKAPNGEATNLAEEQWCIVRTPAFKEWFGDWEAKAIKESLQNSEAISINNDLLNINDRTELRKKAKEVFRSLYSVGRGEPSKTITNKNGDVVAIGMSTFNELKQHSADERVLQIVPDIERIFRGATFLYKDRLTKNNKSKGENTKAFWYYGAKINLSGKDCYVRIVVREYNDGSRYYDHDVTTVEEIQKGADTPQPITKMGAEKSTPFVKHSLAEWWAKVNEISASKVVDENGEPKVMYHGTPYGGFDTFRDESYFTSNKEYADIYQNPSASSNRSYHNDATNAMTYEVFLNIRKPFDTRNPEVQEIFDSEFYRKWGNGAPLADSGLPDWTDATDLLEFIDENEYDFDGIILDEGGTGGYGDEVKSRGLSYVPVKPNQIKSASANNGSFDINDANIYHIRR